ncbi:hypothetical protein [Geminocystis sp. NIES-3708]|uniref:hypothetical protein n=1 Tax=Geminocystis sp. NIES-3708 TaxID=1615909 RepID=UPI0011873A99|nr:hypothetical protein [Geminocystis sp. NIES-3708]
MSQNLSSPLNSFQKKMTGEILEEAGLISSAQLKLALADQNQFLTLKIGEILALRGWLKQETVDFLVQLFFEPKIIRTEKQYPIGQYFKQAGLLTEDQINTIVKQQKQLGIKFCQLAVMKGFLHQQTVDFFLENLTHKKQKTLILDDDKTVNTLNIQTIISDYTSYEFVKDQEKISNNNLKDQLLSETTFINDSEIEYSPMWIDI